MDERGYETTELKTAKIIVLRRLFRYSFRQPRVNDSMTEKKS